MTFVLAVLLVLGLNAHADLIEKMPGASLKEREVRWLWKHLGEFVRSCAEAGPECRDIEIQTVARRLITVLPATPPVSTEAWHQRLKFVSERENPTLFQTQTHESHRIAVTELKAGATVFVNTDRIALPARTWVGLLVHEAVHHLGIDDDQRRLPDKVGAAVAAHAEANWTEGDLSEFGHPQDTLRIFSAATGDRPVRIMNHASVFTLDLSAAPNPRVKICLAGEIMAGQKGHSPLFRAMKVSGAKGEVQLRGSAKIASSCVAGTKRREVLTNFTTQVTLKFQAPFDPRSAWWELPSKVDVTSLVAGNNDDTVEQLDLYRTFAVKSLKHASAEIAVGQEWRTEMTLESTDGFEPTNCAGAYSGAQWFFSRTHTAPWFQYQDKCTVTRLGASQWRVVTVHTLPATLQPDLFFHSFIILQREGQPNRYAMPSRPTYVKLVNPKAPAAARLVAWRALGLTPRDSLMGKRLANSYSIAVNQPFWLEFDLQGSQKVVQHFFDFDFFVESFGSTVIMPWNPPLTSLQPQFVVSHETVAIPGGQRVRYQIQLPPVLSTVRPLGFKLRRLSLETEDGAWPELELPEYFDGMFLTDHLER